MREKTPPTERLGAGVEPGRDTRSWARRARTSGEAARARLAGGGDARVQGFSSRHAPRDRRTLRVGDAARDSARRAQARGRYEAAATLDIVADLPIAAIAPTARRRSAYLEGWADRPVNRMRTRAAAFAPLAAAVAFALLAWPMGQPSMDGAAASLGPAEILPSDADPSEIATATIVEDASQDPEPEAMDAAVLDVEAVEAARYLDAGALADLLAMRPIKCLIADGAFGPDAHCDETVRYDPDFAVYTYRTLLDRDSGVSLEINGAYSLDGDAICHHSDGASALVVGLGAGEPPAQSMERLVNSALDDAGAERVCHRFRVLPGAAGLLFVADAFVDGRLRPDMTDPRPFLMRPTT